MIEEATAVKVKHESNRFIHDLDAGITLDLALLYRQGKIKLTKKREGDKSATYKYDKRIFDKPTLIVDIDPMGAILYIPGDQEMIDEFYDIISGERPGDVY